MEANASIAKHREQVKEDAADAESSKNRHVIHSLTGLRHGDFDQDRDCYRRNYL
jgi:hypothetical protein